MMSPLRLLFALAPSPVAAADDLVACVATPPECVKTAGADFKAGRFAAAAARFEALADAHPDAPKYHYYAGLARENAGDDTAAYLHMRRFLVSDAGTADERERAVQRVATMQGRTYAVHLRLPVRLNLIALRLTRRGASRADEAPLAVPVDALPLVDGHRVLLLTAGQWQVSAIPVTFPDVEVPPIDLAAGPGPGGRRAALVARPIHHELTLRLLPAKAVERGVELRLEQSGTPPVVLSAETPTVRRVLPPGAWNIAARARGYQPYIRKSLVLRGPITVPIELAPKWPPERRNRLKLGLALGGTGLATGIAGAVLLAARGRGLQLADPGTHVLTAGDIGAGLMGTTLGLWITAATVRANPKLGYGWLALAAVASAAGGALYHTTRDAWRPEFLELEISAAKSGADANILVSSALLGFGLGLLPGAIANIVRARKAHRFQRNAHRPLHARAPLQLQQQR